MRGCVTADGRGGGEVLGGGGGDGIKWDVLLSSVSLIVLFQCTSLSYENGDIGLMTPLSMGGSDKPLYMGSSDEAK